MCDGREDNDINVRKTRESPQDVKAAVARVRVQVEKLEVLREVVVAFDWKLFSRSGGGGINNQGGGALPGEPCC